MIADEPGAWGAAEVRRKTIMRDLLVTCAAMDDAGLDDSNRILLTRPAPNAHADPENPRTVHVAFLIPYDGTGRSGPSVSLTASKARRMAAWLVEAAGGVPDGPEVV